MKRWIGLIGLGLLFLGCAPGHEAANGSVVIITEANFKSEVLDSKEPVLIDFWAPWCGPCRKIGPTVEELATEFAGRVKVAKLNVDDNASLSKKFNITSIPAFLIFKNGRVVDELTGETLGSLDRAKPELTSRLNRVLGL